MRRLAFVLLLASPVACTDWPDIAAGSSSRAAEGWPGLLPMNDVLPETDPGPAGEAETERLLARAGALRARAALLRAPVSGEAEFEALRARMAR